MQITFNLAANVPARAVVAGKYCTILSVSLAGSITITLRNGNNIVQEVRTATRGMQLPVAEGFTVVEVVSVSACTVEIVVSNDPVIVDTFAGATVNVAAASALPVSNDRGAPGTPVYVSGITYTDAPATAVLDDTAVAVTAAVTALVTANANRKAIRFFNLDPTNAVAVGSVTLSWAKRCIVLQPGDTWVEERGSNLAWSAICNTALTATVGIQEILA